MDKEIEYNSGMIAGEITKGKYRHNSSADSFRGSMAAIEPLLEVSLASYDIASSRSTSIYQHTPLYITSELLSLESFIILRMLSHIVLDDLSIHFSLGLSRVRHRVRVRVRVGSG